jgi:DNA-directed RNA polymerase specialized sigma24 family protein
MFRGKVTSYRVQNFDDVVIFVRDVESCLEQLDSDQQRLIARIALQEYTHGEAADLLGITHRTLIRRYGQAVDRLTRIFLRANMMDGL